MKRARGVMMHISCLPNKYGFGCFSKEAYEFVDFLKASGQHYWQVLPFNPTNESGSPFQCYSVFAGNPSFIDLTEFLTDEEIVSLGIKKEEDVDFEKINSSRLLALKKIYDKHKNQDEIDAFRTKHKFWIEDYATFTVIKDELGGIPYTEFPTELKQHNAKALEEYRLKNKDKIEFYVFVQMIFFRQWEKLRKYANDNGIKIIGDMAFYPASDSADVWANRESFCFDENGDPTGVAGVPPDYFSEDGQLWGNPLYNVEYLKKNNYRWWIKRFEQAYKFYDMVRLDHFRGFESFWFVPYGAETAKGGKWVKGLGYPLFQALKDKKVPEFLVEDLGIITPAVEKLIQKTGFPNMKVFQFAFDGNPKNNYFPHNYPKNCVAYIGTHDNNTYVGFLKEQKPEVFNQVRSFVGQGEDATIEDIVDATTLIMLNSLADLVILTIQDLCYLDENYRMNTPGTVKNNWNFRLDKELLTPELTKRLLTLTINSNRFYE